MYINYLGYQEYGTRSAKVLSTEKETLTETKLSRLFSIIRREKIKNVTAENKEDGISICIFFNGTNSHIEIIDEEEETWYIYDNMLGDDSDIGLFGYDFPKWSVCDNLETTIDILKEFMATPHNKARQHRIIRQKEPSYQHIAFGRTVCT